MRPFLPPVIFALLLGIAGCSHSLSPTPSGESATPPAPSFSQFSDVPIPEGARMDTDRTLLLGQGDTWVGRLVYSVRFTGAPELFDFYKAEMPAFKWTEVSSVRAEISVMTWQRDDRIATVQIEDTTLGAEVILTMAPVNGPNPASANQPPPPQAAPPPPVTEQPLK